MAFQIISKYFKSAPDMIPVVIEDSQISEESNNQQAVESPMIVNKLKT